MKRHANFWIPRLVLYSLLANGLVAEYGIGMLVATLIAFAVDMAIEFLPKPKTYNENISSCGISVERWQDYIQERFRKDNAFMSLFASHDDYVVGGKTVHIPQMGTKPTVNKNPSSWPLTASQRTDTIASYDLNHYITDPTQVTNAEAAEISYDKMDSVLGDHVAEIAERAADEMLIVSLDELPGAKVVRTTGGSGASETAPKITGQVGNRLICHHVDLKACQLALNLQNIPKVNRYAILESNCLDELTDSLNDSQLNAFNQYYNAQTGQIGRLYGFDIFERSNVAIAADALSGGNLDVDAYGAAVAATDQVANLLFYGPNIASAMGVINPMHDVDRPEYGGDIMNVELRHGGRRKYTAGDGVIALVQATA